MTLPLRIAVCILTYRRPAGLARLLHELTHQVRSRERPFDLEVLVIDNDSDATGREVATRQRRTEAYALRYVVEPRQGIPIARNRALDELASGTDLVCFIDDDEWPIENWLDSMLDVRARTGADCIYGPVEPIYPDGASRWFVESRVFARKRNVDGARLGYAASNNVMISCDFLQRHRLRFEERMRFTGGSDYLFFQQALRSGLRIHWAERALVYDPVPPSRLTWRWVLQRQFRLGNTFAVSDAIEGGWSRRAYRLAYGMARMALGGLMLPTLIVSPYWGMRSLAHLLRGAGAVGGVLGHAHEEYAPARLKDA